MQTHNKGMRTDVIEEPRHSAHEETTTGLTSGHSSDSISAAAFQGLQHPDHTHRLLFFTEHLLEQLTNYTARGELPPPKIQIDYHDQLTALVYQEEKEPSRSARLVFDQVMSWCRKEFACDLDYRIGDISPRLLAGFIIPYSPGCDRLFAALSLVDKIMITAQFNQIPNLQGAIGALCSEHLGFHLLNSSELEIKEAARQISQASVADRIDTIMQLATDGAIDSWSWQLLRQNASKKQLFLTELGRYNHSPLQTYAAEAALEQIKYASAEPPRALDSLVINGQCGRAIGRAARSTSSDEVAHSQRLERQLATNRAGLFVTAAEDAVALLDHSGVVRAFGQVDFNRLQEPVKVGLRSIRWALEGLDYGSRSADHDRHMIGALKFIHHFVVLNLSNSDTLSRAKCWQKLAPELSFKECCTIVQLIDGPQSGRRSCGIVSHLRLTKEILAGNVRRNRELPADPYQREVEMAKFLRNGLMSRRSQLFRTLQESLKALAHEERVQLSKIELKTVQALAHDREIIPFPLGSEREFVLLLQHLHRPDLRVKIESDLGIVIKELPLRSQVHFLHYLGTVSEIGFQELRQVLRANPGCATKILKTFLACAEDTGLGGTIVSIARRLAEPRIVSIFEKYCEITANVKAIDFALADQFGEHATPEIRCQVTQNLLHGANSLLKKYERLLSDNVSDGRQLQDLLNGLENIQQEVVICGSIFKCVKAEAAKAGLPSPELRTIRGLTVARIPANELDQGTLKELRRIMLHNWRLSSQDSLAVTERALSAFEESLTNKDTLFYIVKKENNIIMFRRVEAQAEGRKYFGSFNVREEAQCYGLGGALAKAMLDEYGEQCFIDIHVSLNNRHLQHLMLSYGFEEKELVRDDAGHKIGLLLTRKPLREGKLPG